MHTKKHLRWLRRSGQLDILKPTPLTQPKIYTGVGLILGVQGHNTKPRTNAWERSVRKADKKPR